MFHISKISPFFFIFAYLDLVLSTFYKNDIQNLAFILVFGFIFNTVLGGLYQIVPNSQSQKLRYPWVSYIVFLLSLFGNIFFLVDNLKAFSGFILLAFLIFIFHIISCIKMVKPLTIRFILTGIFYMFLSVIFLNLSIFQGIVPYQLSVHTFTLGVMTNLIIGVLFTWIPMLTMQVLNLKLADKFYYVYQVAVFLFLSSFFVLNYNFILLSGVILLLCVLFYLYIIYDSVFKGKKVIVLPLVVKYFLSGWFLFLLGTLTMLGIIFFNRFDLIVLHVDLMVYGFGFLVLSGAIIHLLPRILWNWFYQEKAKQGKEVPPIHKLINEKLVLVNLYFYIPLLIFIIGLDYFKLFDISSSILGIFYIWFTVGTFYRLVKFVFS
jgi:hypothetical protein